VPEVVHLCMRMHTCFRHPAEAAHLPRTAPTDTLPARQALCAAADLHRAGHALAP
jgi:hypothetical protein